MSGVQREDAAAVAKERLTTAGRYSYICLSDHTPHHAVASELLQDCIWHGEGCDTWSVLVDPFEVSMLLADFGRQLQGGGPS